jgi:signal transduction histidine kinase
LEPKVVGGTLTITARHEGSDLVLRVVDDGVGLHQSTPERQGIGLVNTRARLSELYGSVARLEMRNGDGVSIEITLPFHTVAAKG